MSIKGRQTMEKERVSFNLAKIKKGGKTFEVAVDADLAIKMKKGENIDIKEVVKSEKIFSDVKKGFLAETSHLTDFFNTEDVMEIAAKIIMEGEIQLTSEYRNRLREEKRKRIVSLIATNAIDPKTKLPHPPQRIENAMEEAKVKIDEYKDAEEQVESVVKKLKSIIPIRIDQKKINVKIPSRFAGKAYNTISRFAKPKNEKWHNDGSYECDVDIPPGLEPEFYDKLNNLTHGEVEAKVIE